MTMSEAMISRKWLSYSAFKLLWALWQEYTTCGCWTATPIGPRQHSFKKMAGGAVQQPQESAALSVLIWHMPVNGILLIKTNLVLAALLPNTEAMTPISNIAERLLGQTQTLMLFVSSLCPNSEQSEQQRLFHHYLDIFSLSWSWIQH